MSNSEYKQTDIGTIPTEWDVTTLDKSCEKPTYGYTASASRKPVGVRFLRITDMTERGVDWSSVPFCDCSDEVFEKYRLTNGDILFARIGATTGKSFLVKNPPSSIYASYLIRVRTKETTHPDFLYHFFNGDEYWKQINQNKGNNLKGGVNGSILAQLVHPLPPLPEQRTIAAILSKIQQAIEQQEKIIERTKELKKSLMAKLFTEGLRGEELKETEIGLIPKSWEVVRFGDVSVRRSNMIDPNECKESVYVGLEHIESGNPMLKNFGKAEQVRSSKNVFMIGDILYGKLRPYLNKAILSHIEGICSSDIIVFYGTKVSSRYLVHLVHTENFLKHAIATTTGVNHPRTSWDSLSDFRLGLPKPKEQEEIVSLLESLGRKIQNTENKIIAWKQLFKSMLHQLMTGQIRVNKIEIAP